MTADPDVIIEENTSTVPWLNGVTYLHKTGIALNTK